MKLSDVDILVHPGLSGGSEAHWYTGWLRKFKNSQRVEQPDFEHPDKDIWIPNLVAAVEACTRPVVIIGHSMGVITTVHAAPHFPKGQVIGAFLVAPGDEECMAKTYPQCAEFSPIPNDPLPFPSVLVASRNDPHCSYETAENMAYAWGSRVLDAGESGHLTPDSGHGPWPEGMMRFASFLSGLS